MTINSPDSDGLYDFILGNRVYFDPTAGMMRHLHGLREPVTLDVEACSILLEFARAPHMLHGFEHLAAVLAAGDGTVENPRHRLARIIRSLRHALRSLDPSSIYIARMPRLGYILVEPVTVVKR